MRSNRHSISRQPLGRLERPLRVAARDFLLTSVRQRGRIPAVAQVAGLTKLPADTPGARGPEGDHLAMRFAEHGLQCDRCPVLRSGVPADREEVRLHLHRARPGGPSSQPALGSRGDASIGNLQHDSSLCRWREPGRLRIRRVWSADSGDVKGGRRMSWTTRCPTRGGIQ